MLSLLVHQLGWRLNHKGAVLYVEINVNSAVITFIATGPFSPVYSSKPNGVSSHSRNSSAETLGRSASFQVSMIAKAKYMKWLHDSPLSSTSYLLTKLLAALPSQLSIRICYSYLAVVLFSSGFWKDVARLAKTPLNPAVDAILSLGQADRAGITDVSDTPDDSRNWVLLWPTCGDFSKQRE